jgi:transposase
MSKERPVELKTQALKRTGTLNRRFQQVKDARFVEGDEFFDAKDLLQVKYEMLRRVDQEEATVSQTCRDFGISRPAFYQARGNFESRGLAGLIPVKRGPRGGHKLTSEMLAFVRDQKQEGSSVTWVDLVGRIKDRFGVKVHPRSIKRALKRAQKKS